MNRLTFIFLPFEAGVVIESWNAEPQVMMLKPKWWWIAVDVSVGKVASGFKKKKKKKGKNPLWVSFPGLPVGTSDIVGTALAMGVTKREWRG